MPCFVNGMRLNSHPHVDKDGFLSAYYWRDGGLWGCKVSEIYPNVFAYNDEYPGRRNGKSGFLWSNIRHTKLEMRMDKEDYKRIMRCIEITDHRSKNANVKNLKVPLNKCKRIKIPKGLTLEELRKSLEYIGKISVFKADYSDKKEEDV